MQKYAQIVTLKSSKRKLTSNPLGIIDQALTSFFPTVNIQQTHHILVQTAENKAKFHLSAKFEAPDIKSFKNFKPINMLIYLDNLGPFIV